MDSDHRDTGRSVADATAEKGKRAEDVGVKSVFNDVMNTRVNQRDEDGRSKLREATDRLIKAPCRFTSGEYTVCPPTDECDIHRVARAVARMIG